MAVLLGPSGGAAEESRCCADSGAPCGEDRRCRRSRMLRAFAGGATCGRRSCYLRQEELLPTLTGGAASSKRQCYQQPAALLQAVDGDATDGRRLCYRRPAALRRAITGDATDGRPRCYEPSPEMLPPASGGATRGRVPLLHTAGGAATDGRQRCYRRPAALLRAIAGDAPTGLRWCYQRQAAVLRRPAAVVRAGEVPRRSSDRRAAHVFIHGRRWVPAHARCCVRFFLLTGGCIKAVSFSKCVVVRGHVSSPPCGGSGVPIPRGTLSTIHLHSTSSKKNSTSETSLDKSDVVHVKYLEVLDSLPEKEGPVSEASFGAIPEGNSERVEATADERLVPQRMVSEQRDSSCCSDGNQIPREASTLKFEATLRDDSREIREAKYRRIRNEEKGEVKQPVRLRDRSPRSVVDTVPPNAYPSEHSSEYHMKSRFRDANGTGNADMRNVDGPNSVSGLKKDRTELLRVLDELRDQVQRSCEITEKPSGSASTNRVADASSSCGPHERLSRLRHGSPQLQRNSSQHSPSLNGQTPGIPHAYASVPTQPDLHGYREPVAHMGAPCYPVGQYPWRNCDNYFFGQYNHDPLISYHHDGFYHQPACSCLHCYHREFLTVQGASMGFNHRRAPYQMNNPGAYPVDSSVMFGMQNSHSRGINASMQRGHMRANLSKKPAQKCEPIACGAPFTICYNCYEVLQLPKKSPLPGKDEYKLRCGSCSHAIVVKLDGSRLDVSAPSPISHRSTSSKVNSSDVQASNSNTAVGERLFPLYSFSAGSHGSHEKDLHSNSSDAEKNQGVSSSSSIFEDENSPARSNSQRGTPGSRNLPLEAQVVTRVPSLPLRDHFGYSPSERVVDGSGKGSRSTRSEHEKSVLTESFKHNTIKDVRVVSVMDLSDDEYEDPYYSQDPGDGAQHVDRPTVTKTGDSFFTNLIKKSFKINNGIGNGRSKVFINGYPISDRAVRKAEKIAGPIYPGEYWYDYRAGFWGVMGQSCLGMIPPYIPELNYPMPKNCAGGNTGVFINGRELHQKDFDLLVGRGLSESPDRSYKVEMCGKVYDEVSGEELYCLGKLAPTVEKMKRGFGMRPPRIIH